jgi:hypothetical protein
VDISFALQRRADWRLVPRAAAVEEAERGHPRARPRASAKGVLKS